MELRCVTEAVTEARRRSAEGQIAGHQVPDADVVHVLTAGNRADNVCLSDEADRLLGLFVVEDDQCRSAGVLHQVGGRRQVGIAFYGRQCWSHDVPDGVWGRQRRGGWFLPGGAHHDSLRFRDLDEIP